MRRRRTPAISRRWRCSRRKGWRPTRTTRSLFSGKHDQSVMGVDSRRLRRGRRRLRRLQPHGRARPDQGRRLPHHLPQPEVPDLVVRLRPRPRAEARDKMLTCFYDYRFPPEMQKAFDGADRFFPINYQKTGRSCARSPKAAGDGFNKATYEKEARGEAARRRRRRRSKRRCAVQGAAPRRRRVALSVRGLSRRTSPASRCSPTSTWISPPRGITAIIGPSGTGKSHADPLHQPAGRADRGRDPLRRPGPRAARRTASCARRGATSAWCSRSTTSSSA